jgi:hypothetical protein
MAGFPVCYILEDILFGDPAFVAGAGDGFQLAERDAFACGDIEDEGGVESWAARVYGGGAMLRCTCIQEGCLDGCLCCGWLRGGMRRCGGLCRGDGRSITCTDPGDDGADRNHVVDLEQDLFDDAFRDGGHLGIHFVGGNLQKGLILLYRITGLFVPFQDRGFHDAFTHFWHYQVNKRHNTLNLRWTKVVFFRFS